MRPDLTSTRLQRLIGSTRVGAPCVRLLAGTLESAKRVAAGDLHVWFAQQQARCMPCLCLSFSTLICLQPQASSGSQAHAPKGSAGHLHHAHELSRQQQTVLMLAVVLMWLAHASKRSYWARLAHTVCMQSYIDGLPVFTESRFLYDWTDGECGIMLGILGLSAPFVNQGVASLASRASDRIITVSPQWCQTFS